MTMFKQFAMSIVLILLTIGATATAQPTTAPAGADEQVITRVYEITDFQLQKRDYPAPRRADANEGGMRGGGGQDLFGGGQAPTSQPSGVDIANSLVSLIEDTVATETWRDYGGTVGSIRQLYGLLIVN